MARALEYMHDDGDDEAARAPYIPHLYKRWKLSSDLGSVANATEIVRSRDWAEHIHVYS